MRRSPLLVGLLVSASLGAAPVDFAHEVVPILRKHCSECHTGDKKKGGLSMNTRASLLEGSENGVVVTAGQSQKGKLLEAIVSADPDVRMPPKGERLTLAEVSTLRAWVEQGAVWTEGFAFKQPAYEPPLRRVSRSSRRQRPDGRTRSTACLTAGSRTRARPRRSSRTTRPSCAG